MIASNGHSLAHFPQPIQALAQALRATAPLSLLTQLTKIRRDFGPFLRNSITFFGQAFAHAPQAVHLSSSTSGKPVSGLIWIASKLQAFTQSPYPKQPNVHPVSPPYKADAIAQLFTPSYLFVFGRAWHVPLQRTTATFGSAAAASLPKIVAIFAITGAPPTGQSIPSNESALTQAPANPAQPGYPQPPQLAPGSTDCTCPIRGSSWTSNFLDAQ